MVSKKDFEIGDLVWAKMKCFPFWPAKIVRPPTDVKHPTSKKPQHYVFFFGTENYAWIPDENIEPHSDEMLQSISNKKKSQIYKSAIEKISEENQFAKKVKSPVKEKESPKKSPEVSTSNSERKISRIQKTKVKTESPKIQKKTTPKRRFFAESEHKSTSPPRKLSKKNEDYSGLLSNTPPNLGYNRVAVIRPLDDHANSLCSSGITRRDYFELQPGPSLDLQETSKAIQAKNIRPTDKKIGFIGLGMMGQRLVKNLLNSKHKVTVWNRTPDKCNDFFAAGAALAQTPGDVVEKCDIIFCCVSGPDASKSLVFGNCGILSGLEKCSPGSKGYVEMTTIDPITSREIAEAISHKGGRYLEAPISGSRQMAEEGALLILGAGDRELFTNCESCFFALSKNAYYLSCDVGSGSKMNLILSMLMGISHAALAEAMALVERCNLSQTNFLEILELGPLHSTLLSEKGQAMLSRYFATNTSLKYQQKDLNLALSLGNMCEQPMLLTAAANELFKHAKLLRYSDHDVSAVYLGAKY
ncbi:unnamed protein product [Larinioides sclopetarius]|uniref:Cytokine-like nuclear factor N-PAC n=1 Tax=Larinioides sclopetarius TaxID=280406 RepID=A0AAV2A678_9ARAC